MSDQEPIRRSSKSLLRDQGRSSPSAFQLPKPERDPDAEVPRQGPTTERSYLLIVVGLLICVGVVLAGLMLR